VDLTGALKVNTKEDMTENSRMIVVWGANIARARTVMNVIITEKLYEAAFVRSHTIGSEEPSQHALPFILRWERRDVEATQIIAFARANAQCGQPRSSSTAAPCTRMPRLAHGLRDELSTGIDWRLWTSEGRAGPAS
jgi:anaerobic selenocysteine-containing dehydrogenase